jgi:hypothetical protein
MAFSKMGFGVGKSRAFNFEKAMAGFSAKVANCAIHWYA